MDNNARKILFIILFLGAILRIWGVNFGLPYQFHQDEPIIVNHALAYGTGDLNPHFFAIPPLTSYVLFFVYSAYFVFGRIFGLFVSPESFAMSFFKDPAFFYLLGRVFIGFLPGILCVILIRALYKSIFSSEKGALFAAAVISFSFLNVVDSHYIYTDMLMLFLIILSMARIFSMYKLPSSKHYIIAGLSVGCAAAVKYNAVLLVLPFFIAHLLSCKNRVINKNLILGGVAVAAAFCILNPFALLDYSFFISSVLKQGKAESFTGWFHHVRYSLFEGADINILILGLIGCAILIIKDRATGLILLSFPAVFFLHIVFFGQRFARYAIPLTPFLAIGGGYLLFEYIFPRARGGALKFAVILLSFLVFVPLIVKSAKADSLLASKDTRVEAADWLCTNVKEDSMIALDHTFFRPPVLQNKEQLTEKLSMISRGKQDSDIKLRKAEMTIRALAGKKSFYLYFLSRNPDNEGRFISTMPVLPFDSGVLEDNGIDYVVVNYADRQRNTEDFYKGLKDNARLAASFSPYEDGSIRSSYDEFATTCFPVLSKEVYSRVKAGPALEIYRLKK